MPRPRRKLIATTTASKQLVPEPLQQRVRGRGGLQVAMGLYKDRSRFRQATKCLRTIMPQFLDMTRLWVDQDSEQCELFLKKARTVDRIFSEYENCWPARHYAQAHLRFQRTKLRANMAPRSSLFIELDQDADNDATYCPSDRHTSHGSTSASVIESHTRVPARRLTQPSSSQLSVASDASKTSSMAQRSAVPGSAAVTRMSAFRALLHNLDPILGEYFEKFELAGIECESGLQTLLSFPRHEQESFLREQCGIARAIEMYRVRLALENARERLPVIVVG